MARIDDVNLQILHLLQRNARLTIADLAKSVGRSESTVRDRVVALESDGILRGYEAQIDWTRAGLPLVALLRGRCAPGRRDELQKRLAAMPNVVQAIQFTGPRPIVVIVRVRDLTQLESVLGQASGDLVDVECEVMIDALVDRGAPLVPAPHRAEAADPGMASGAVSSVPPLPAARAPASRALASDLEDADDETPHQSILTA